MWIVVTFVEKPCWMPFTALTTKCKSTKEFCDRKKKKFQPWGGRGRGEGGEGGDCGSGASIRISWLMVHRLREADDSVHCSSALKYQRLKLREIPSEKTKQNKTCTLGYTVDWGKGEKIGHYIVRAWWEGGGVVLENVDGAVQHPIRDQYEIFPALFQTWTAVVKR